MRITIVNQYYPPDLSPTAHLAASLAEHRADLGDEVTIITSAAQYQAGDAGGADPPSDADDLPRQGNLRVIRCRAPRHKASSIAARAWQYLWFYIAATGRLLWMPGQDIIISLTTPPYIAWSAVLHRWIKRRRCRVILWNMALYPDILEATRLIKPGGLVARCLRFVNRRLLRRLDHVVCLDQAMVGRLRKYAPRRLPMTVIPNWEASSRFPIHRDVPPWPRIDELGLADRFLILYLGNAGYGHEFDTVLRAAERLCDAAVTFLFVGGGSKREGIHISARARGLNNVYLHDYVAKQQTPAVLAAADLALITLSDEALGVMCPSKLHANLAMGLPVVYVGPQGSNVDQAICQFNCGVSLRHGDAAGLAAFVRSIRDDPEQLHRLSTRAREAFDEAYCDQRTLPQFDEVLALGVRCSEFPFSLRGRLMRQIASYEHVLEITFTPPERLANMSFDQLESRRDRLEAKFRRVAS